MYSAFTSTAQLGIVIIGSIALLVCWKIRSTASRSSPIIISGMIIGALAITSPGKLGRPVSRAPQFEADNCALPNDGVHDDAAPLRACMAAMPAGGTMTLDPNKSYFFDSHSISDPTWGTNPCELYLRSQQVLNLGGATITRSPAEAKLTAGSFMVCAGSNNQTNPVYVGAPLYNVNITTANASSITTTDPADAGGFEAGDYGWIGDNPYDENGSGWFEVAAPGGDATTGVIPLVYPLVKPYVSAPTIANYSALPAPTLASPSAGPLASNIWIENGTFDNGLTAVLPPILFAGNVGGHIFQVNEIDTQNFFIWGNNNHLSDFSYDTITTTGCLNSPEPVFQPGEYTSSWNTLEHDTITVTSTGCLSTRSYGAGSGEGGENNYYAYDTITIASTFNQSACLYQGGTYDTTFNQINCTSQALGLLESEQTANNIVENSQFTCLSNWCLFFQSANDQALNNQLYASTAIYIANSNATISNNDITIPSGSTPSTLGEIYIGNGPASYGSTIGTNTFENLSGLAGGAGIELAVPASVPATGPLSIAPQNLGNFVTELLVDGPALDYPSGF